MNTLDIALVNCPPWTEQTPPVHIGLLTAFLRSRGHKVHAFDFNIESYARANPQERYLWSRDLDGRWIKDKSSFLWREIAYWCDRLAAVRPSAVGISVLYDSMQICTEFAKELKRRFPDVKIIFGGPQCQRGFLTKQFLAADAVDYYVIGEGEETLSELLTLIGSGKELSSCPGAIIRKGKKAIDCGDREPIMDLDSIPFPDYSDLPLELYTRKGLVAILGSRGCIAKCAFCQDHMNIKTYRTRSAGNIFREMELRYSQGFREFYFNDLAMNGDTAVLESLCDLLIGSEFHKHINFGGQMRCRREMTEGIYRKLKSAGCHQIMFGVESGSQKVLGLMKKGITVADIENNLKHCSQAGILAEIALVVGFPGETEETFRETISLLQRNSNYIDTIAALYALDLRVGSPIATDYPKYGVVRKEQDWYWHTEDGNTFEWRLRLIYDVLVAASDLGIKLGFDETHFYFYHAIRYYHIQKKDYDKSFQVMEEALQYLSSKIKKLQSQLREQADHHGDKDAR